MSKKQDRGSDLQRAQEIIYRANMRVLRDCGLRYDWSTFMIISHAAVSTLCAEVVRSDDLMRDGGERVIQQLTAQFASMLREDFKKRIDHERAQTRQ